MKRLPRETGVSSQVTRAVVGQAVTGADRLDHCLARRRTRALSATTHDAALFVQRRVARSTPTRIDSDSVCVMTSRRQ